MNSFTNNMPMELRAKINETVQMLREKHQLDYLSIEVLMAMISAVYVHGKSDGAKEVQEVLSKKLDDLEKLVNTPKEVK